MSYLFFFLSAICNVYLIVCFISIAIGYIPGAKFTSPGKFLAAITDPYLNFFKRFKKLTIENIDFSPILALGFICFLGSNFSYIASLNKIYFGGVLSGIVLLGWKIISFIFIFFGVLALIRWFFLLSIHKSTNNNPIWEAIDNILGRVSYKVSRVFCKKTINYKTSLLITWISITVFYIGGKFLFGYLSLLCLRIPF